MNVFRRFWRWVTGATYKEELAQIRKESEEAAANLKSLFERLIQLDQFATYLLSRAESCASGDDKTAMYLPALFEALRVRRLPMRDATAMIRGALPRDAAYCAEILLTGQPWDATLGEMGILEPPMPTTPQPNEGE